MALSLRPVPSIHPAPLGCQAALLATCFLFPLHPGWEAQAGLGGQLLKQGSSLPSQQSLSPPYPAPSRKADLYLRGQRSKWELLLLAS